MYEIPKQLSHSAFTAFANNPISIVDPTGMVWQDTTQRNTLIQAVNDRKSKILKNTAEILSRDNSNASEKEKESDQAQLKENEQMVKLLNQSLQDIQDIDQAEEVFTLTNEVSASGSATVTLEEGVVQIGGNGVDTQLHEIRHIGQSFAAGGMKWASENGVQTLQNAGYPDYKQSVLNEMEAYKTGFAYSRAYPVFGVVKLNGINEMNLFFIKDQNGNPVYSNLKTLEGKKK